MKHISEYLDNASRWLHIKHARLHGFDFDQIRLIKGRIIDSTRAYLTNEEHGEIMFSRVIYAAWMHQMKRRELSRFANLLCLMLDRAEEPVRRWDINELLGIYPKTLTIARKNSPFKTTNSLLKAIKNGDVHSSDFALLILVGMPIPKPGTRIDRFVKWAWAHC